LSLQLINAGTRDCDATGDHARRAFNKTNQNFAELYALAGFPNQQLTINIGSQGTTLTPGVGTSSSLAFPMINANFTFLFSFLGTLPLMQVILMGGEAGMIVGQFSPVIGTGDPARVAWLKVNSNFTYLYEVL
jgi:hypothetical protein